MNGSLRRELGLFRATMIGIGGTLSAGNFVILGHAASLAGSTIVIVVFVCGIISLLTMFSYCELGTVIPHAGSEYTFAKVAYGGFIAFLTGWFEWLSNMFYATLSAIGVAYIISYVIPINVPLVAIFVVILFAAVNIRGVKEVGTVETILTIVVLTILGIYAWNGWSYGLSMEEFKLSAPQGLIGIFAATAYLFELYLGAEAVAVAQAEIKNPEKTIPRAMILSSVILIILYTTIVYVTLKVVPPETIAGQTSPITFAAEQIMGKLGAILVTIALAIAGLAATNEAIMAQSRTVYALSRDGYFPKAFSKIHKRFGTPYVAVVLCSIFTIAFTSTGLVNFIVYAVNLGFILGFSIVNLSLIKLRKEKPRLKRPFKAPLYPFTPIAGIIISLILLLFIDPWVMVLGAEATILAYLAYHFRMVGYHRIRIAIGGINLGIGCLAALLSYLMKTGVVILSGIPSSLSEMVIQIFVLVSAVYLLAGVLNVTAKT
jgi:APA family basic amino acid/polyamine antiporter